MSDTQEPQRLDLEDPKPINYEDGRGWQYVSSGDLRVPFYRDGVDDPIMGRSNSEIVEEQIKPALKKCLPHLLDRIDFDSEYSAVFFTAKDPQDLRDLRAFIVGYVNGLNYQENN